MTLEIIYILYLNSNKLYFFNIFYLIFFEFTLLLPAKNFNLKNINPKSC